MGSSETRSQPIRLPAAKGEYRRIELRSPDPTANPYIAYALLIMAGLDGIERELTDPEAVNVNLYKADSSVTEPLDRLPASLDEAVAVAEGSDFVRGVIGMNITDFLGI